MNDIDAVRKRPGMYVGSVYDDSGLTHMVWEVVANSLDQHLAGRCARIDVIIEPDGSVSIEDDGPGIPIHPIEGGLFAEVALTRLHATPTFDGHAPHEHVGLRGVGLFAVNALSSWLVLDVHRGGHHHRQRFERGYAKSPLEVVEPSARTGTRLSFLPYPTIFERPWLHPGTLVERLRELAWLLPALTLSFEDRRNHVFHAPRGLRAYLEHARKGATAIGDALSIDETVGAIRVEVAAEWLVHPWAAVGVESYANIERTTEGGTHVRGLLDGLAAGLRDVAPGMKRRPKGEVVAAIERGLNAVVCVRLNDPKYGAPTKARLETPEARAAVAGVVRTAFAALLRESPSLVEHFEEP